MKSFAPILAITQQELKTIFNHPTAFLLLDVFLVINAFFFFRSSFLINVATLRPMFDVVIYLFLFLLPSLTMRQFAEEKRQSTLEVLFAQPVRSWHIVAGKFLASGLFLALALGLTLSIPFLLSPYGHFDWGAIIAQYLGALVLGLGMLSVGLFASSLTNNQVTAFLIAVSLNFLFVLMGFEVVLSSLPTQIKTVVEQLSMSWHFQNLARGVLDARDGIYFLTLTVTFLFLTAWFLVRDRVNPKRPQWKRLKIGTGMVLIASVIVNLLGLSIHGRLDLTKNQIYTLSRSSAQLVQNLDQPMTITLYRSEELPSEITTTVRDVEDLLTDLSSASNGNIELVKKAIRANLQEAQSQGIQPVQFNVVKSDEFQLKQGVFGLTVVQGEKKEVLPFIEQSNDFELKVLSLIRQMTISTKPKIGFLTGHGEKSYYSDYAGFVAALEDRYEVTSVSFNAETNALEPGGVDVIVVAGPTQEISEAEQAALQSVLKKGGKVFLLIDPVTVEMNTLTASSNPQSFARFAKANGVDVQSVLIGDLASNESVTFGGGQFNFVLPYPFWLRAERTGDHLIQQGTENVVLAWASPLQILDTPNTVEVLYSTSTQVFTQQDTFTLNPDQDYSSYPITGQSFPVAATVTLPNEGEQPGGRMVVIGDSDFLTENFTQEGSSDLIFGLNAMDWLAQDELLISVRSKQRQASSLTFERPTQKTIVRNLNLVGVPFFVAMAGGLHLRRRRRNARRQNP